MCAPHTHRLASLLYKSSSSLPDKSSRNKGRAGFWVGRGRSASSSSLVSPQGGEASLDLVLPLLGVDVRLALWIAWGCVFFLWEALLVVARDNPKALLRLDFFLSSSSSLFDDDEESHAEARLVGLVVIDLTFLLLFFAEEEGTDLAAGLVATDLRRAGDSIADWRRAAFTCFMACRNASSSDDDELSDCTAALARLRLDETLTSGG